MKRDFPSRFVSHISHRLHPKIGKFYDNRLAPIYHNHIQFFNDQFVELIGLIIANTFVFFFSFYFIGFSLVLILFFISTPVTMVVKYMMRKHWVWKK